MRKKKNPQPKKQEEERKCLSSIKNSISALFPRHKNSMFNIPT